MTQQFEAIISIHPIYCKYIESGDKKIELRRTELPEGDYQVYETKAKGGRGAVTMKIHLSDVSTEEWAEYHVCKDACVSATEFNQYKGIRKVLYGHRISNVRVYSEPILLYDIGLKRPPQSWCRIV